MNSADNWGLRKVSEVLHKIVLGITLGFSCDLKILLYGVDVVSSRIHVLKPNP